MITQFKTLFTIAVSHAYYNAACRDFDFILPKDTAKALRDKKLIAKIIDSKLHVMFAADESGLPLVSGAATRLPFGLKLLNPRFTNFTDLGFDAASENPLYANTTLPAALAGPTRIVLRSQVLAHALSTATRPVTVTLRDPAGVDLGTETVTSANNRASLSYDLRGHEPGIYRVEEAYLGETKTFAYFCSTELVLAGAFGVIDITIDSSFYTHPPAMAISFQARKGLLKYYIVAKNYTDADVNQLSVKDEGHAEEHRTEVHFDKVTSNHFGDGDLPPATVAGSDTKVVLFRSKTEVSRQEKARKKMQLKKNGDVLISQLPQPGSGQSDNNIIVRVAKV